MQLLKRTVSNVVSINKQYVRSVTIGTTTENSKETEQFKSWREIPGPSSLPIIGQMHHFLPGGSFHKLGPELGELFFERYGPIVRLNGHLGAPPLIFILDAEASSHILRSENWLPVRPGFKCLEYYRKHKMTKDNPDQLTGLLTEHGEPWKKFRSIVNPIMLHSKIIKLYASTLEEVAEDMVARMKSKRNNENMLDCKFDEEMNLWSFESIGVVALGCRLNCLDPNLPPDSPERRLIQVVHEIFDCFNKLDFKPSPWRYISTPTYRKAIKLFEEQIKLNKYFISKGIEKLKKEKSSNDEKSVLEKLTEIDESVAITMASDMLFAGVDTAANTIIAILYLLATNPEKQNKLREEINSGDEKRSYTKACLKESHRMMPIVAGNLRQATKDYNILGYKIPKDMLVTFGHQYLSLTEKHFPQPSAFIPERWIVDKTDPLYHGNAHPFAYSPFGFGVRSCIGRRIAELEIETFLAKLIKNFEVGWMGPPPEIRPSSLNYIVGPFNFTFKDV